MLFTYTIQTTTTTHDRAVFNWYSILSLLSACALGLPARLVNPIHPIQSINPPQTNAKTNRQDGQGRLNKVIIKNTCNVMLHSFVFFISLSPFLPPVFWPGNLLPFIPPNLPLNLLSLLLSRFAWEYNQSLSNHALFFFLSLLSFHPPSCVISPTNKN